MKLHRHFFTLSTTLRAIGVLALIVLNISCGGSGGVDDFIGPGGDDGPADTSKYKLVLDPPAYDFGSVKTTDPTPLSETVTVTNNSTSTLFITSVSGPASTEFTLTSETCTTLAGGLAAAATCSFTVEFNPDSSGPKSYVVGLMYGLSTGSTDFSVSGAFTGYGRAPAELLISDGPTYDFGDVVVSAVAEKFLRVSNIGDFTASSMTAGALTAPFDFKGGAYPGTGGNCSTTLPTGATCFIVVTFSPTSAGGQTDSLSLSYDDTDTTQIATRALAGTGQPPANLTISDSNYDYGSRPTGSTLDKTYTITNTGGVKAFSITGGGLAAPFTFKGGTYPGTGGTCGTAVLPTDTCTIVVTFAPTATGVFTDDIEIGYNNGLAVQTSLNSIQGTGVTPAAITISNNPLYDFGTQVVGTNTDATITLTNSGGFTASSLTATIANLPFTFKAGTYPGSGGTCTNTLAPAASCTLVLVYSPTNQATHNTILTASYFNGVNNATSNRNVRGDAKLPAVLTLNQPTQVFDYGTKAIGSNTDQSFTITNSGASAAVSVTGGGLASPFDYKGGAYPGTGGTCTGTIAAASTCTIVVTYSPLAAGNFTDTIEVSYSTGVTTLMATKGVKAIGVTPANITISDGPTYDFGDIPVGKSTDKTFTVTNAGGIAATAVAGTGLAAPYTFKGGSFPGLGGTCNTPTINPNATCTIVVNYLPSATGVQTDAIDITYNDGASAQTSSRPLTANAVSPASITISDGPTYDFGLVGQGALAEKTFTLTNAGSYNATAMGGSGLTSPFKFKNNSYPGGGTCGATLAPAATCTIVVQFSPSTIATFNDAIDISYNNGVSTQTSSRAIQGIGTTPANLTISDGPTYTFGNQPVGIVVTKVLTITNIGGVPANSMTGSTTPITPFSFDGGSYPGTGGTCASTLAANGTCTIVVQYNPTSTGTVTKSVVVNYNNTVVNTSTSRAVTGVAVTPASLTLSSNPSYDFGIVAVGATKDATLTVTNGGGFAASAMAGAGLAAPFDFKGGAYPGTGGGCTATLNPGASCTIVLTLSPTAAGGLSDTVDINYSNGVNGQTASRALLGTGATPATLTISDGVTYDFGTLAITSVTDKTFTVTNGGGVPATSMTGTGLSAPYTFKGGSFPGTGGTCSGTLLAAASCTLVVTYAPTVVGTHTDTIEVNYTDGVTAQTSYRDLTAIAVTPALLTISDGPVYDFGTVVANTTNQYTFTITNTGATDATSVTGSGLAAPFAFKGSNVYPGNGGTCGPSIVAGSNCTIVVTYIPPVNGPKSDTIDINYKNGSGANSANVVVSSRNVQGTAAPAGVLAITPTGTVNFGTIANTGVTERTFTVTNSGGVTVTTITPTGLTAPYTFKGGAYPGTGGTCGANLLAATACTMVIEFSPTAIGTFGNTVTLGYYDGSATKSTNRAMTGTAVAPALLTVNNGPIYDYGTIATGGVVDKTFTVTNGGNFTASNLGGSNLSAPFSFKGGSFPGTGGSCAANGTLNAATSCTIVVRFSPTVTGAQTATMHIDYYNGASNQFATRDIQGTGAVPALLTVSNGPVYNYGTLANGGFADATLIVTNTGGVDAQNIVGTGLAAPFAFVGGTYPGTGGSCSTALSPTATCTVVIRYNPTAVGTFNDTLTLNYDDGAAAQSVDRDLTGIAVSPALLAISDGATYNYQTKAVGSSTDKAFTVTNTGAFAASAISGSGLSAPFTFKGGNAYPGVGGTCGATLAAGASCTYVVTYAPTANGVITKTASIAYNNGAIATSSTRPVTGTGAAPASVAISNGPTYNYGTRATGSITTQTFTITNSGGVPADSIVVGGLSAPFDFTGGTYPGTGGTCGVTLNALATCLIAVDYSPTATGAQASQLDFTYNNGITSITASRPVTGTGATPANLSVSDGPVYDYGQVAIGNSVDRTFTITNTGGVPATTLTGAGLAAPFVFKGGTFPGTAGTCTSTLLNGNSCTVVVRFTPVTPPGLVTDTADFAYYDGASNQTVSRDVQGTGMNPASLTISDGPTYDYGSVVNTGSADKTFTVTNSGQLSASALAITGLAAPFNYKGGTYPGTGGNCPSGAATLAPAATCLLVVSFKPTSLGAKSATMTLAYNNQVSVVNTTRPIQGTGVTAANLTISNSPSYDFGSRATNGSTDATLTITNGGGYFAASMSGGGLTAPFTFKDGSYPGTGGTCTTTLAAATSCTIVVNYSPVANGLLQSTMSIAYNDGLAAQNATRNIKGTGVPPAVLTISDGPTYDYLTVATGGFKDKTFTVTNAAGGFTASSLGGAGLAAPFAFKGGTFPGTGGTCTSSLAASLTCTIVVTYSPVATGTQGSTINVTYNDGANPQTALRNIQGTGAAPALLTITDGPLYNYGTLASGGSADKTFTIANAGGVPAASMAGAGLTSPFAFKGGTYPGTGGTCAATLNAAASCTVIVTYNPTNIATHTNTLVINYNDGVSMTHEDRDLTGNAVAPASLAISDGPTYDYGTKANGSVTEKTFTVTNTGSFGASAMSGGGLTSSPFDFKGGSYPGSGGDCSVALAAGATCTIVVTFSPIATGTFSKPITLTYNNGAVANATGTRNIQGTGAPPAALTISNGPTYSYGTKATGSTTLKTFTVTNTGGVPATSIVGGGLAAPYDFDGGTYPGTGGTCATTLPSTGTCTIIVSFAPLATGVQTDTIDFTYHNGIAGGQTANRPLAGTGAAPASVAISDGPTYDYGNVGTGGTKDKIFTLTNSGGVQTESILITGLAAPFSLKGGSFPGTGGTCTQNLAGGNATCTIVVSFAPTVGGLQTDTIDLGYNDGVTIQSTSRDIQGTGVPPALLTISDGATFDYGAVVQTGSADKTFTVSNTGSLPASSMVGFGLAAPFSFKGGTYPGSGGNCGGTLNTASTCTIVVTFNPSTPGAYSDQIDLDYNNGVTATTTNRPIQGTGATPANLTVSNGPTYSFGTLANGGSQDATLTVTNSGGVSATSVTGSGLAAPYTFRGGTYPGTGGTCTATIAAAASCTVVLNYSPTSIATHTATLSIDYQNGLVTAHGTRGLTGTAVAPASLAVSDGPTYDYLTVATGGYSDKTFTITNTGSYPASSITGTGLSSPFTFVGGTFPGGGTCTATLNAGGTCTFIVRYAPVATGLQSNTISIGYNNGAAAGQTSNRNIQGTGAVPALLTLSDGATYNYGTLANGATMDHTFTVTNTGGVPATAMSGAGLTVPYTFKAGTYPGTGGTCGATLGVAATCTVVVTFNPTSVGSFNTTLSIPYTDGVTSQSVTRDIQGNAVAPAVLAISDGPTYDFGTKANGSSTDKTFTITNNGAFIASAMAGAGLTAPYSYKGGSYPGTGGDCSATLASAATCTIVVTFAPTTSGLTSRNINISYNNGATTTNSLRAVQGTGATAAVLTVSDATTYDFGLKATGSSTDKVFTISNSGAYSATSVNFAALSGPFGFKDGTFPGTGGDCSATIAGSASCTIVVTYAPTGTGLQTDTISITYNDGVTGQSSTRPIQGTAAAPASLAISDGVTYNFGSIAITGSAQKTFTVTNSGGVQATALAGSGLSAPYSFTGGTYPGTGGTCGTTLNASATCTMNVTFAPTAGGAASNTMSLGYNNGVNAQTATRGVTGTGVPPANLTISDGTTYNYGSVVQAGSADKTFTVTNSGSLPATSIAGSGLSAPFTFKGGTFPGTGGDCAGTLAAAGTCVFVVTFNPSTTGSYSATASLSYNNGVGTVSSTRAMQGTGVTPANITISNGPTFSFGTIANNGTVDATLTITNGGGYQATSVAGSGLAAPFTFKDGAFPGTGGSCTTTLAAAASCTMVFTYAPTTIATHSLTFSVNYNNGLAGTSSTRNFQGISVPPAVLSVSDGAIYDYGTVATGGTATKTFTITNASSAVPATSVTGSGISAPFTFVGGVFPGGGTCTGTLAASGTCTFIVQYAPSATGLQSGTINIGYNDGAQAQSTTRGIQGTGAAPAVLSISDAGFTFGTVANGSSNDKTFTITNSGGVPATGVAGSGLSAPYTFKGGTFPGTGGTCGASITASGTCTFVVNYSPTSNTTHNATISVTYNDGVAAGNTSTRPITGTAVSAASLSISDGATFNFGTQANGSATDKTFTITNGGSFTASSVAGSGLSAPYSWKGGGAFPGAGGTCATTLAGGATCTFIVTYAPTSTNTYNATITATYNNGAASGQTSTRPITGASAAPASITVSDGPTYDYGTKATGSSTDKTFTVTNSGGVAGTSLSIGGLAAPYTFAGGSYPGTGGDCGTSLAAGTSCVVVVTYAPTGTGVQNDALDVSYHDGVMVQTPSRAITGTGAAPALLTVSDGATYNFGSVAMGATPTKTLTITNGGGVTATAMAASGLSAPYSLKGGTYPGTGGTCGTTLGATLTCTVVVEFAPTSTGILNSQLNIGYNDGVTTQTASRPVTGTGVTPAILTVSDGPTYDYGNVVQTGSLDKTFTVTNSGSLAASSLSGSGLSGAFAFKGGTFPGTGGTCTNGGSLAASGATCTFVVTFTPPSAASSSKTISVGYNNGVSAQSATRDIQGTGVTPASLTISNGPTFSFGSIANNGTVDGTLTITNGGGYQASSLTGSGLSAPYTFKGGGAFPGTGGTCTATLAAGASCTMILTYSPTSLGTHTGTVSADYNNGLTGQSATRNITGTAVAPALLTVSDGPTYDYLTVATGGFAEKTFTITNSGAVSATALSGSGLSAPFAFKGGTFPGTGGTCVNAGSLAASGTCTIVVRYSPSATGVQSGTMNIGYNDGAQAQTATRGVQGTGANPALLAISDGAVFNYGTVANGSTTDKTFTITNSGGVPATGMSGSGLAAPFSFKAGTYPGTGGSCGTSLASAATCTIVVSYIPSTVNTHSDTIDITYTDGVTGQTVSRDVVGTAVSAASLSISDGATFNFGTQANGSSTDKTFTITNGGSFTASSVAGSGLSSPYSWKGGGAFPGSGGTCAATLAGGATCTFVVTYAPLSTNTYNATITATYNNGAVAGQTATRPITGASAAPASIAVSDGPTYDFGTKATGSSTDKTFTVTNSGGVAGTSLVINGLAAPYTFKGGSFPGTGGDCSTSLSAGTSCLVVVTYAPTGTGVQSDALDVSYHDGVTTQTPSRAITGTGANPASLSISDGPTYNYGSVAIGAAPTKTFTVTNGGGVPATAIGGSGLTAPFSFSGGSYPGGGTCGTSLAASATCTIIVTYTPTASVVSSGSIDIGYSNGVTSGFTASRAVAGTGVTPAVIDISDATTYSFGSVVQTGSADHTFTITNSGSLGATSLAGSGLSGAYTFKGGSFPGNGGTCTSTLAASATCLVVVTFTPPSTGSYTTTLNMTYNNGVSGQTSSRNIDGTGATPASLAISNGPTYSFGSIANNGNLDATLTVTNNGGVTATSLAGSGLSAPYTFKGGTFPGTGGTCVNGGSLAATLTCTIVLNYAPTTLGTHNLTVSVDYQNGITGASGTRNITGTAVAPANLTVSDGPTYDYLTVANGGFANKTFTITNSGAVPATSMAGSGLAAPFAFVGGTYPGGGTCSTTLAASGTCTIIVRYSPSATGTQSDTIDIAYNDGAQAQAAHRDVQGTGALPASLAISDGPTYDYGTKANGSSTDKTFTITNNGGVPATGMSGSGLAAPYQFKGGSYPGTGGATCSTTLAAASSCTIVVTYNPSSLGASSDTIDIGYTNGVASGQTVSRDVTGTAIQPATLTISDGSIFDFGNVVQTGSMDKTFTITNTGAIVATSIGGSGLAAPFTFKGGNVFPGNGGTCSATLAGGNTTCTVVVTFAPPSTGSYSDTMDIGYNNGVSVQNSPRDMQGTGATPASLSISNGPTYSFGSIANNGTLDATLTVTNGGGVTATSLAGSGLSAPYSFKGGTFPGTGGSCTNGGSLAAASTCTIVLTFAPTSLGTHNATVSVDFYTGLANSSGTRNLTGTAVAPASLSISDAGYDYGTVATGGNATKTFTITNSGAVPATSITGTNLSAPFTYSGGSFPGGGTCSGTLAASGTCTFIVKYAPTGTGVHNGTININYNDGAQAQMTPRAISGNGAAPASLAISDGVTFDFGSVANGGTLDKTFTVTNSGGVPATSLGGSGLSSPYSFKGGSFPGTGGTCTGPVAASGTCTFVVTFAPTSLGSGQNATISVSYTDGVAGGNSATRAITGTGVAPATITISDGPTYNFGPVANTATLDKTLTITNTGAIGATSLTPSGLSAPFTFAGGTFPGAGGDCTSSLTAGATCLVVVRFSPTAVSSYSQTLTMTYHNGVTAGQTSTRAIQGQGVTAASLSISDGATYNYNNVATGGSLDKTFTITNGGGATATLVTGSALSAPYGYKGGGAFPGTGGTCTNNGSLAGGGTCTYIVTYSPSTAAVHNATVTVTYTNGITAGQTTARAMTGTGVAPASLSISGGATYNYGTIANGNTTTEATFTITNSGAVAATGMSGSGLSSPYAFKGGSYPGTGTCSTSLNPAATCTIIVTFIPAGTGTFNGQIDVGYNDGATTQTASRPVTGTAVGPAVLTISDGATYDYGTVVTTTTKDKTFTITNTGGYQASGMGGSGLAAPMVFKGGSYPGTGGDCGATLNAGATCLIVVRYTPTASVVTNKTITITYNDGATTGLTSTRAITGTGAAPANITISDTDPYDYGNVAVGASLDHAFVLTNSGGVTATSLGAAALTNGFTFTGGSYPGTGGSCGTTLNGANATCIIMVNFAPVSTGAKSSTLSISYNDGATTQTPARTMQGVGSTPASLSISNGPTFDFGTVAKGSNNEKTFTVTNSGGVAATSITGSTLSAPYSFKGGSFPGSGATCTGTLAGSSSCTVIVAYNPSTAATHNATLQVNYFDALANQNTQRPMTGTAANPAVLTVSDGPTYDFGSVFIGNNATKIFTVNNTGSFAASSITGSGLATPYSYNSTTFPGGGSCGAALGIGGTCSFIAKFAPTGAGTANATASVDYNDGANPQSSTRDVTGLGVTPTPPSTPVLTLAITAASQIDLSWTASTGTGPITYDVKRSTTSGSGYTTISAAQSGTTYVDTGVTAGTTYYYVITTTGLGGTASSIEKSGKPIAAFTITSATAADRSALITWSAVAGATTYTVSYGTASGTWNSTSSTSATSIHTVSSLTAGTPYYFMVTAVNSIGSLNATSEVTATPYALATSFAAGPSSRAMCAVMSNNQLRCWGQASYGMLGNGAEAIRGDDYPDEMDDNTVTAKLGTGRTVSQLALSQGGYHACAVLDNGKVKCWGQNQYGQLGYGDTNDRSISAATAGDNLAYVNLGSNAGVPFTATKVAVGSTHSCAILNDGRVKCWGRNNYGQLGIELSTALNRADTPATTGDNLSFVILGAGRTAIDITAGAEHTCAILDNSTVKCWGRGDFGQLGNNTNTNAVGDSAPAGEMTGLGTVSLGANATSISAGSYFTCATLQGGTAKCWGRNNVGQLAIETITGNNAAIGDQNNEMQSLGAIPFGSNVLKIKAGWTHACAVLTGGVLKCWGQNANGQLGYGTNGGNLGDANGEISGLAAVQIGNGGLDTASDVYVGNGNTCVLRTNGGVRCWGLNSFGQLANGDNLNYATIGDGGAEMDAALWDWNSHAGTGRNVSYAMPGQSMICAIRDNGSLACFGHNLFGQLGIGEPAHTGDDPNEMGSYLTAVNVGTGRTVKKAAIGQSHVCAILDNDNVKCWGRNQKGQLGYGDTTNRGSSITDMGDALPYVNLGTSKTAKDITAGLYHTCAILNDNTTKCWGYNGYGQLGILSTADQGDGAGEMGDSLGTVDLGSPRYAVEIKAGDYFTCARLDNNAVKCWGRNNNGQLGQNNTNQIGHAPAAPVSTLATIALGTTATAIGAGSAHACALLTGGTVKCWGLNTSGQLGQGVTAGNCSTPNNSGCLGDAANEVGAGLAAIALGTGRTATSISVGGNQVCAVLDNNTGKCWGNGGSARLGLGGSTANLGDGAGEMGDSLLAINIGTGLSIARMVTQLDATCAQTPTGVVKCWGYNLFGTTGNGDSVGTNNALNVIGDSAAEMGDGLANTFLFDSNY